MSFDANKLSLPVEDLHQQEEVYDVVYINLLIMCYVRVRKYSLINHFFLSWHHNENNSTAADTRR